MVKYVNILALFVVLFFPMLVFAHMKLKIGVMGSVSGELMEKSLSLAFVLNQAIGQADCYLVIGGCPGLPLEAARGTKAAGELVIGISPGLSLDEHIHKYGSPIEAHDRLSQDSNICRTNFTNSAGRRRYHLMRKKEKQNATT